MNRANCSNLGKKDIIGEVTKDNIPIFHIKTITPADTEIIKKISLEPMVSKISTVSNDIEFEYSGSEEEACKLLSKLLE